MTYEEAAVHLRGMEALQKDGSLNSLGWYLRWSPGSDEATLDGEFTAHDLLAVSVFMRGPDASRAMRERCRTCGDSELPGMVSAAIFPSERGDGHPKLWVRCPDCEGSGD
jgi:hypothetical protein